MALKLSGMAAKNFALFVYAVLKDQKKIHGKTRLVRMLKEQRPFKFFNVPTENMKEFAKEAKVHGLLYVPIRNKKKADRIEVVVFADDASKIQRISTTSALTRSKRRQAKPQLRKCRNRKSKLPQPPARRKPSKPSRAKWNLRWAVLRTISISAQPSRIPPKILLLAGRRNQIPRQWKRVRPSLPRPAKALRPTQ